MKKFISIVISSLMAVALFLPTNAVAYKVIKVKNGATITGKVTFAGSQDDANQHNKEYTITKDTDVCGIGKRKVDYVKVNQDGELSDVVVYLDKKKVKKKYKPVRKGKAWAKGDKKVTINQKGCEFLPFFTVMANKGKLHAINSDQVAHNIHTYALIGKVKKTKINVSQPPKEKPKQTLVKKKVKLSKKSHGMKVECDQHDFMHSFVFVAKNPYYAVVKKDGTYKIDNVPNGKYKVQTWHGYLKNPTPKFVTIKKGKIIAVKTGKKGKKEKVKTVDFEYENKKK